MTTDTPNEVKLDELKNKAFEAAHTLESLEGELNDLNPTDKPANAAKKLEVRRAKTALNKADKAVSTLQKKVDAIQKSKANKDASNVKELARAAKADTKAKAEADKVAEREANRMPEQNGVRRPKPTTKCGRVWEIADMLSATAGQPTPVKDLLETAKSEGLNEGNTKAEYARWRKFHGVSGRIVSPRPTV